MFWNIGPDRCCALDVAILDDCGEIGFWSSLMRVDCEFRKVFCCWQDLLDTRNLSVGLRPANTKYWFKKWFSPVVLHFFDCVSRGFYRWAQGRNEGERWDQLPGRRITAGAAEKSQQCHKHFLTVRLLPKDSAFEHRGAEFASLPGCHLTSLRPWLGIICLWPPYISRHFYINWRHVTSLSSLHDNESHITIRSQNSHS